MQKTTRILSIISVVLVFASLVLLIASMPLQKMLATAIYHYPNEMVAALPMFPVVPFITCLLQLGCIVLLFIGCGSKGNAFWAEILVIVLLAVVLPVINGVAQTLYVGIIGRFGSDKALAVTAANQIATLCSNPANWGIVLGYITCGMSIASKVIAKKQEVVQ